MKNIDRIRMMDTDQLAKFLTDNGAETPLDFCQGCEHYLGEEQDCPECEYNDDLKAWKNWLNRKVPGEADLPERTYTQICSELYGIPASQYDLIYRTNLAEVEKALGFPLYRWQKEYICSGGEEFRRIGKTTARHLRLLITRAPNEMHHLSRGLSQTLRDFDNEITSLKMLKDKLTAAGIAVNKIKVTGRKAINRTEDL